MNITHFNHCSADNNPWQRIYNYNLQTFLEINQKFKFNFVSLVASLKHKRDLIMAFTHHQAYPMRDHKNHN